MTTTIDETAILEQLKRTSQACRKLIQLSDDTINTIILKLADLAVQRKTFILTANQKDLDRMDKSNPKYDRLLLSEKRLEDIATDLRNVASLPSPLNKTLAQKTLPNGLELTKVSVPLGAIGIVYESRPNVTFDVFALCLKSGNASVLKGSRDAHFSNLAIIELIHEALAPYHLKDACYLTPSDRASLPIVLQADHYINAIIPRGSQGLINFVRTNSKVPVIETGAGIVHIYFDQYADTMKGQAIIKNAKTRRVSVCNALDTLIIHAERLSDLPSLLKGLDVEYQCEVFADERAYQQLKGSYNPTLLQLAKEEDFGTEFLAMKMSIKTVDSIDEALDHVDAYSSKHSESIVSENIENQDYYLKNVDAAVVYANASTGFTDGAQFGFGAEIGISTQKLHARGPMALPELTSYKWIVKGNGQIRK